MDDPPTKVSPTPPQTGADRVWWPACAAAAAAVGYLLARYVELGPVQGPWAYWPTYGILVGILFRRPAREWTAIGAAAVAAQVLTIYLARGDLAGGATVAGAILGFAQAAISVLVLRGGRTRCRPLGGPADLAWFVVVAVILGPLAITPLSALFFSAGLGLPATSVWAPLFAGNSLSVLIFAPPFLTPHAEETVPGAARLPERLLCQAGILALALVTFAGPDHLVRFIALPYAMFPFLAWSVLRCGPRWTSLAVLVVATVAAWCTARGLGPFGGLAIPMDQRVLGVQAYLALVAFTALVLTALVQERLRSLAELSLRDSIQQAFFESSARALMMTDREGRPVLVNTAILDILGRRRTDVIGRDPAEYLDGEDAAVVARHNARVLEQGVPLTFDESLASDGGRRRFVVTRFPVRDHTGEIRYIGLSARDDSMERELNSRLQGVQRVEILGRLAAGVAHDLNNLLTAVVGNTALLLGSGARPRDEEQMLRDVREAGEAAARLTQRLLALGRGPPIGRTEAAEVDTVLRGLEPLLRVLVRSNVVLRLQPGAPGARVAVDPTAVGQIVLNLVANARDAIPSDGTITIETAPVTFAGAPGVRLRVSDTGAGMDAETVRRIFEPFFTTKDASRGSGIGLYTVDAIVRQAEGEITATSTPGAGTVFTVDLPAVP